MQEFSDSRWRPETRPHIAVTRVSAVESLSWLTTLCMSVVIRNDRRLEMTYGSKPKMYPNVALALAALALLLLAGRAAGETAKERLERFQLFGDCKPMFLIVEALPPGASKIGLTVDLLQAAVESRLRAARLYDSEVLSPYLYVNVNVVGKAHHIELEYTKWVFDPLSGLNGSAATWSIGGTGTHGGEAEYVLSLVSQTMDQFLLEFLRVNDEACEKRSALPSSQNTE